MNYDRLEFLVYLHCTATVTLSWCLHTRGTCTALWTDGENIKIHLCIFHLYHRFLLRKSMSNTKFHIIIHTYIHICIFKTYKFSVFRFIDTESSHDTELVHQVQIVSGIHPSQSQQTLSPLHYLSPWSYNVQMLILILRSACCGCLCRGPLCNVHGSCSSWILVHNNRLSSLAISCHWRLWGQVHHSTSVLKQWSLRTHWVAMWCLLLLLLLCVVNSWDITWVVWWWRLYLGLVYWLGG